MLDLHGGNARSAKMAPNRRLRLWRPRRGSSASKGYERASLNRIIGECAMSKSSFDYFVGSKDALFDAVVDEIGQRLEPPAGYP